MWSRDRERWDEYLQIGESIGVLRGDIQPKLMLCFARCLVVELWMGGLHVACMLPAYAPRLLFFLF